MIFMREKTMQTTWPLALSQSLIQSLSTDDIEELTNGFETRADAERQLNRESKLKESLRKEIVERWRTLHAELVQESYFLPVETSDARCEWMVRRFGVENVILEMITDPSVGWRLTEWTIENLKRETDKNTFRDVLRKLANDQPLTVACPVRKPRIVIFGGHVRDERKMQQRVLKPSRFDVRWVLCEKKDNGTPDDKQIIDSMGRADAVLIITSMVSHVVMQIVKSAAKKSRIPWSPIQKATDLNITSALNELLPDDCYFPNQ